MRKEFYDLYNMMSNSQKVENMRIFGNVHKEMMEWFIQNKPEAAEEWLTKLESIKWKNYLTPKEAERIVASMNPKAPWSRDQWKQAMEQSSYEMSKEWCYNSCALWVTMNMIMSDSSATLEKYVDDDNIFSIVYDLAVDKLTDSDANFSIRKYFNV